MHEKWQMIKPSQIPSPIFFLESNFDCVNKAIYVAVMFCFIINSYIVLLPKYRRWLNLLKNCANRPKKDVKRTYMFLNILCFQLKNAYNLPIFIYGYVMHFLFLVARVNCFVRQLKNWYGHLNNINVLIFYYWPKLQLLFIHRRER